MLPEAATMLMTGVVVLPQSASDVELVEQFKAGDEQAYNEIVRRYSSKVLTLCGYYLKDSDEAYDLSQEVFLKLYRGLKDFRGEAKLSTWIHTVAINACKNRLSSLRRLFFRRKGYDADPERRRQAPGPDEMVLRTERRAAVLEEIRKLPEKFREIIILKDIQDTSYESIAKILDINDGTVKSRLHRARLALQERLKARGFS
ncbi:MAG: sigma-70 family RNA polymerase sigma factor [Candidatus Wallbacteria bacterium]|nr:sigma-70 family RNA polymerase sigma factor [Candidatus Wallbacteria bacterium]MBI4869896.1 sigma-70 family RNA polymerase sigma factor [Candidatus Wallbacteria bacterium]